MNKQPGWCRRERDLNSSGESSGQILSFLQHVFKYTAVPPSRGCFDLQRVHSALWPRENLTYFLESVWLHIKGKLISPTKQGLLYMYYFVPAFFTERHPLNSFPRKLLPRGLFFFLEEGSFCVLHVIFWSGQ